MNGWNNKELISLFIIFLNLVFCMYLMVVDVEHVFYSKGLLIFFLGKQGVVDV